MERADQPGRAPAAGRRRSDGDGDDGAFGRGPQSPDTMVAVLSPGATGAAGSLGDDYNEIKALSTGAARPAGRRAASTARPARVSLDELGDYRVLVDTRLAGPGAGDRPAAWPRSTTPSRACCSAARCSPRRRSCSPGCSALVLVRRQLRPLREVAATAYDVTAMPLDAGGQTIETRVPDALHRSAHRGRPGRLGAQHAARPRRLRARRAAPSEQQVRQFVADASHELRTPLSTIHGYAELSRRTARATPRCSRQAMRKVETEATRMSTLVADMLLLARLDSGRPLEREEVDVTRLLLEAVADAKVVAPDHVWRLDLPEEPVTVVGDEQRLHQVVTNLINNARRHTPAGTTVTVGARATPGEGEDVRITVHDDGPGIPDGTARTGLRAVHPRRHVAHPRVRRRRARPLPGAGDRRGPRRVRCDWTAVRATRRSRSRCRSCVAHRSGTERAHRPRRADDEAGVMTPRTWRPVGARVRGAVRHDDAVCPPSRLGLRPQHVRGAGRHALNPCTCRGVEGVSAG